MPQALREAAGVHKLSNEILSIVFEILEESSFSVSCLKRTDWVFTVSHTCQHWRSVALGNPLLWTHLTYFTSMDLVRTFLERSKGLKFSVTLYVPFVPPSGWQESFGGAAKPRFFLTPKRKKKLNLHFPFVLEQCGNRIEKLDVIDAIDNSKTWSAVSVFLQNSPQCLRHLSLHPPVNIVGWGEHRFVSLPAISENTPSLNELYLTYTCFKWNTETLMPPGLTVLHLASLDTQPTLLQLLTLLSRCSELEDLHLSSDEFSSGSGLMPKDLNVIHLPRLQRLYLGLGYHDCATLLKHLRINQGVIWEISCKGFPAKMVPSSFSQWILNHTKPCLQLKLLIFENVLEIEGYNPKDGIMIKTSHLSLTEFEDFLELKSVLDIFKAFVHGSAWISTPEVIVHLDLMSDAELEEYHQENWSAFFRAIPNTTSLIVVYDEKNPFSMISPSTADSEFARTLRHLGPAFQFPAEGDCNNIEGFLSFALPHLSKLTLKHFDFKARIKDGKNFWEELMRTLEARHEGKLRLEKLDIRLCSGLLQKHVKSFSKYVNGVISNLENNAPS